MVIIQTDDEQKSHDVERNLIRYLKTYDDMLNCIEDNNTIQLSMVQYPIFLKMIEYTKLLINNNEQKDKDTFLENVHNIKELIIMADFANFEQLLEDLQVYLIKKQNGKLTIKYFLPDLFQRGVKPLIQVLHPCRLRPKL